MKKNLQTLIFATLLPVSVATAQSSSAVTANYQRTASKVVESFRSSLLGADANQESADESNAVVSPYLYQLTSPGIYYSSIISDKLSLDYSTPAQRSEPVASTTSGMEYRSNLASGVTNLLANSYVSNPHAYKYYDSQIASESVTNSAVVSAAKIEDLDPMYEQVAQVVDVADVADEVDVDLEVEKPNFWTTNGRFSLQFTQNYFSENWYRGGNNNVTLLSNLVLEANYNDQKSIQWDNKLDLRLGFVTATSDSCHKFLSNNDRIALNSKLGVKAAKFWYYTLSLEGTTQFLPGYRSNDRRKYSGFISPLDVYVSLGMDFKPTFKNKNTLSCALLPLSYKMRYIDAEDETIHKAYNMADKDFQQDFGSKIEIKSQVKVATDLTWRCRFYYFTSYKYTEAELENVLSFQFNKYITSEVYTLWRFDDNRSRQFYDSSLGYFQFKEYFTLGLTYNF